MIDMEVPVITALEPLVDGKVFRWVVPDEYIDQYPYIRVIEIDNTDEDYRDNKAIASDIIIQIDLWVKDNPVPLLSQIDNMMKSLEFKRIFVTTEFDEQTGVIRKIMRYKTTKLKEE